MKTLRSLGDAVTVMAPESTMSIPGFFSLSPAPQVAGPVSITVRLRETHHLIERAAMMIFAISLKWFPMLELSVLICIAIAILYSGKYAN